MKSRRRLIAEQLEKRMVMAATPFISEFLASNSGGLRDVDGDSSDWIEIYNPTDSAVDLSGWQLTDDPDLEDFWTFPSTVVDPGQSIVVFASDKDRAISGEQLHTNFRLASGGDFLRLQDASGTVISEFAPTYPPQATNVSYGVPIETNVYVESGAAGLFAVPGGGIVDTNVSSTTWTDSAFDDAAWLPVNVGVGFGVSTPGFNVTYVKARSSGSFNGNVNSIAVADQVLNTPAYQSLVLSESVPVINYFGSGAGANFGNDLPFPNQNIGDDINHFVIQAEAKLQIPTAGTYTFGVNSDDGFRLELRDSSGTTFTSSFPNPRAPRDTIQSFNLQAGQYDLDLVMFEAAGGASVELFAASGSHSSFNGAFRLVGDVSNGGLFVQHDSTSSPAVQTDVSSSFAGVNNASSLLRIPFDVSNPAEIDGLDLEVAYNDGFVAWINGIEVARAAAPINLTSTSAATSTRDPFQTIAPETFTLDASARSTIQDGENVLAIQLLNDSAADDSLLMSPRLTATRIQENSLTFFATPTPGEINRDPVDGVLDQVVVDLPAGFYETNQAVSLSHSDSQATIRYTLDGSEPTESNGMSYLAPISVSQTTVIRTAAFRENYIPARSVSRTYLFLDDVLTQSNDNSPPPGWPSTWNTNEVDYGMDPNVIASEGAEVVKEALRAVPTLSISTDLDNLFDSAIGIYSNARQDGRDWERPASAEWINPDGTEGFQVNAGLRIRGGFSRNDFNPKHSFKLYFRGAYGESELNYPLHGDRGVSQFKQIDLRTAQNYSWSSGHNATNNFVAEVMARRAQRDLDQPYTRSTWFHLYLNGQYWGIFQTQERADANYAASYFGGDADQYDVVKPGDNNKRIEAIDGNMDAYTLLWEAAVARAPDGATPAFVDDAAFLAVQGKNPDGSDNLELPVLLDVENLITYMMITLYGGNLDAPISNFINNNRSNNYFGIYDRNGREGFQFFQHDAEHTLRSLSENRNGPYNHPDFEGNVNNFNPQWLHQQLMANDEYRLMFADAVQHAFFNEGPLSPTGVRAVLDESSSEIDQAVIGESVRWGDGRWPERDARTRQDFINALNNLRNNYIPQRTDLVINQFRNTNLVLKDGSGNYNVQVSAPLYPGVNPATFLVNGNGQHGGEVSAGDLLSFGNLEGTVYYTTDGADPRMFGNTVNPNASTFSATTTEQTLLSSGAIWRYDDTGVEPPGAWNSASFDDSSWSSGPSQLGYGDGDESTVIEGGPSNDRRRAAFFRTEFQNNGPTGNSQTLTLRVRRDDGVAIYLNGVEVVRDNLPPGTLTMATTASSAIFGDGENDWIEFSVDPSSLVAGTNVIAARVHQISATSSDLSFDTEVILRTTSGGTPIPLNQPTTVSARTLAADGAWSALQRAVFSIPSTPASADNLRITELHYHPADPENTEFVELQNISNERISLEGVAFTDAVEFTFGEGTFLEPGGIVVLADDQAALQAAFPELTVIGGQYEGGFRNSGEDVEISAADGSVIQAFTYDDNGAGWHPTTDGDGPSLTIIDTQGDYSDGGNWRPSVAIGGTPGAIEVLPANVVGRHVAYGGATAGYGEDAIVPNVDALLPGQTSTANHYTNYLHGINRVVIDLENAPATPTLDDFEFSVGVGFSESISAASIDVASGVGTNGSDRVTIAFANGSVVNQWLRVTVLATERTGLTVPDVFYFGNQIGDVSGVSGAGDVTVNSIDTLLTRFNQSLETNSAGIENP
ncbi:MAG: lamin tail domain-containing protein, partial [Planctomycetota bacterium]